MEKTDGELLADAIDSCVSAQGAARGQTGTAVKTRRVACTMGCERACNIIVQGAEKIGYSLGKFDGTEEDAQAIVDYAIMHADSPTGQVPFRNWPQGVKGHFVSRHLPPPPEPEAEPLANTDANSGQDIA